MIKTTTEKNRRFKVLMLMLLICGCGAGVIQEAAWGAGPLGLTVDAQGRFLRQGFVYRGIGVDYFDAFEGHLMDNPSETAFVQGFQVLGRRQIPFTRVILGGFWPIEQNQFTSNTTVFFQRMDAVVKAAEDNNVGIVADLFWCYNSVPDIVGEHMVAWNDVNSKSYTWMRQYIDAVVGRYKDSPAIWGWECGNEYNLQAELPDPQDFLPPTIVSLGCPATRDPVLDIMTSLTFTLMYTQFAQEVRKIDPNRMIDSGNSIPRWAGWNIEHGNGWVHDTQGQFNEMLQIENPGQINTLGVHIYAGTEVGYFGDGGTMFWGEDQVTTSGLMAACMQEAATLQKPVFLGESGAPSNSDGTLTSSEHQEMTQLISAITDNKVPLAAFWNYNRTMDDPVWNITDTNARSYQLDMIQAANTLIRAQLIQEGGYGSTAVDRSWVIYQ